jgi:hypothetical protein
MHSRNMVYFWYIIVNAMHNGDNKDDDDEKVSELLTSIKKNCRN